MARRRPRAAADSVLQAVDRDARELARLGLAPRQLAAFAQAGSLAARLALGHVRDGSPDPEQRAQARAWIDTLGAWSWPTSAHDRRR